MLQLGIRAFLAVALLAIGVSYLEVEGLGITDNLAYSTLYIFGIVLAAAAIITVEATIPKKSLQALSGVFFGVIVGLVISFALNIVVHHLFVVFSQHADTALAGAIKLALNVTTCYLCVSFVLQTKDDIRFVIPYVEFAKQLKGQRPLLLDTSVIIDGRISGICEAGFLDQVLIVPRFVLHELQLVADSADRLKRARGRRGLDVLNKLQDTENVDIRITDIPVPKQDADEGVDLKLLALAKVLSARVATNDYNLNKVAKVRGIDIININDLANALKPVALPGESMSVRVIKPGEEQGQGIAYLDDGTMVVIEHARKRIGDTVAVMVTSVLQTSAGRMIFGRITGPEEEPRRQADKKPARQGT